METNETAHTTPTSFLDDDLSTVDTSMPLITPGLVEMVVGDLKEEPSKGGDKTNLVILLKTTKETQSTAGETLHAGFPLTTRICLTPTPNLSQDAIKKRVAAFVQALNGKNLRPVSQYKDKVVLVKVAVRKARTDPITGEEYPESNDVKMFVKPE